MAREQILIVDDDADHLAALGRSFRLAGYTVTMARDGESALEEVARSRPALVLSDVLMPASTASRPVASSRRTRRPRRCR
jgi:CheY-like chemotaxis protein